MLEDAQAVIRGVGRRVAELRRSAGLTQEQLAEQGAVTVRYLRRIEGGRENLTLSGLVWLANLLGVRTGELLVPPQELTVRRGRPRVEAAPVEASSSPVKKRAANPLPDAKSPRRRSSPAR